jgi:hypothetical protein
LGATFEKILRDKFDSDHYPETGGGWDDWLAERLRSHRNPTGPFEQKHSNGRWYSINERRTDAGGVVVVSSDMNAWRRWAG